MLYNSYIIKYLTEWLDPRNEPIMNQERFYNRTDEDKTFGHDYKKDSGTDVSECFTNNLNKSSESLLIKSQNVNIPQIIINTEDANLDEKIESPSDYKHDIKSCFEPSCERRSSDGSYIGNKGMNLSFAGCGFLGIYHVGVSACLRKYAPGLLVDRISGASAGSLAAVCLLCDVDLGEFIIIFF